jgi:apolipoprotein N-acyltransferase
LFVPALALAVVISLGVRAVAVDPPRSPRTLRMALVQPAIPQEVVWDQSHEKKAARFASLLALSEAAVTNNPAVVVWPEAALPGLLRWSTNQFNGMTVFDAVTGFARRHKVWMVIGADDAELTPGTRDEVSYYNSSFLINPAGEIVSSYRKRRLVMFGEYVPLSEWFPFLKRLAHVQGEFTPGTNVVTFDMAGLDVQTSVLICFEDVFPHVTREHVKDDTDFSAEPHEQRVVRRGRRAMAARSQRGVPCH